MQKQSSEEQKKGNHEKRSDKRTQVEEILERKGEQAEKKKRLERQENRIKVEHRSDGKFKFSFSSSIRFLNLL